MSVLPHSFSAILSQPSVAMSSSSSSSFLSSSRFSNGDGLPGVSLVVMNSCTRVLESSFRFNQLSSFLSCAAVSSGRNNNIRGIIGRTRAIGASEIWKLRSRTTGCFVGKRVRNLGILGFHEGFGLGSRRSNGDIQGGRKRRSSSTERDDVFFSKAGSANVGEDANELLETSRRGSKPTKLLTLPTILTLCRVAAVPALLAVFYSSEEYATVAGTTIFVAAAITDWLDGYLARKMDVISEFGAFLDPVADKLMVAAALVLLCTRPLAMPGARLYPWILPLPAVAIIGREITMSALREWAASQGGNLHKVYLRRKYGEGLSTSEDMFGHHVLQGFGLFCWTLREAVAVSSLGKLKTASQMVAITLLLATQDGRGGVLGATGVALLYIAAGLALWSLALYIKAIFGNLAT